MCSCFAIAGGERLKVDATCELRQEDWAGLRAQRVLPKETGGSEVQVIGYLGGYVDREVCC